MLKRVQGFVVGAVVASVVSLGAQTAQRCPDPPMSTTAATHALNAMKVSQARADAAQKSWKSGGYEKPPANDTLWAYSSHYNRELKRCLILVTSSKVEGRTITDSGYVFDAIEQLELGSLWTKHNLDTRERTTDLVKFDGSVLRRVPDTPENLDWYRNLMLR